MCAAKKKQPLQVQLDHDIAKIFEQYCEDKEKSPSAAINEILTDFFCMSWMGKK